MKTITKSDTNRKGDIGEKIIRKHFALLGYSVTEWVTDCSHLVDCFVWRKDRGLSAVEVKTYGYRIKYNDTGIDKPDFETYMRLSCRMPVLLFFVDTRARAILYGRMSELAPEGVEQGGKVYFPLKRLKTLRELTDNEVIEILEV